MSTTVQVMRVENCQFLEFCLHIMTFIFEKGQTAVFALERIKTEKWHSYAIRPTIWPVSFSAK